jgi:N6-adenosine-specific RNA methylase IME4
VHDLPAPGPRAQQPKISPEEGLMFATVLADPPWRTHSGRLTGRAGFADSTTAAGAKNRPLPYSTMTVDEICSLPVGSIAADDACLFLWATNGYLPDAFRVIAAWGFRYSTTLVWSKALMGGGLGAAFGISTEFLLFARRGRVKQRARLKGTVYAWKRPYRDGHPDHSAKPPESFALIEQVAHGPYVELFSRAKQPRIGWSYWGNESLGTATLSKVVA